jgi:hypothetical protein
MLRFAFAVLVLAGCAAVAPDAESSDEAIEETNRAVQMNDVSILLPMTPAKASAYLTPDSPGRGGALLPKVVYQAAVGTDGTLGPGGTPGVDRTGLKLVSMRFDPCFASLTPIAETSDCENQLRVVFQPIGNDGAKDAAVHAFFSLTRDEVKAAVNEIVQLRLQFDGGARMGALAVHPIVQKQGIDGALATGISAVVLKYAGASNLVRFTQFSSSGLGTAWNFRGFDIDNGAPKPMVIPTLPNSATMVSFFRGFTKGSLTGDFTPSTTSTDDMQLLGNAERAKSASSDARTAAFTALQHVEDPTKHSPNTIDCASCHGAEPARLMVASRFGLSASALTGDEAETTKPKDNDDVDLHMFSYKGLNASIHRRTILESAAIAHFMNAQ